MGDLWMMYGVRLKCNRVRCDDVRCIQNDESPTPRVYGVHVEISPRMNLAEMPHTSIT